jgi:micrococcal nuclease
MFLKMENLLAAIVFISLGMGPVQVFTARVIGVDSSCMLRVQYNGVETTVDLYGIDCPERNQSYGKEAREYMKERVEGKTVEIQPIYRDSGQRLVAIVRVEGEVLNRSLVEYGYAWIVPRECTSSECGEWKDLGREAKRRKTGLWANPNPVPPWTFRTASN